MNVLTYLAVWLNALANTLGRLLTPIAWLPGWLSATIVAGVTGVLMLIAFKYTSNQRAIRRARNDIKANLLALKLFKESVSVALRSVGRVLLGAGRLMILAVVPMLVMAVPMTLLLGQLALWYQARPLTVGEEAVMTLKLGAAAQAGVSEMPDVRLTPTDAVEVVGGPVQVQSKREVCWNVKARQIGYHRLAFDVDGQPTEKELAIGDGFMRVSLRRPEWSWSDVLLNPGEQPYRADAAVQSIDIEYPRRASWTSGTDRWIIYWFAASMVAALIFRRWLNVNL